MGDEPYKRQKLSPCASPAPSVGPSSPFLPLVPAAPQERQEKQDVIEFFAARRQRTKALESEVQRLESFVEELKQHLARAQASASSHKVSKGRGGSRLEAMLSQSLNLQTTSD